MNAVITVIIILVMSVFIKRFMPAKGFLVDESIERLTYFGESRVIELRNLDGYQHGDLVTINEKRAVIAPPQQQPVQSMYNPVMPQTVQKQPVAEGVSLDDIKGKQYSEVDTDYMYSNIDSSDESLADTLRKGKL